MKIGIDIDGTLTDFKKFLIENSQKYMQKKHGLKLTNPDGYDIDQMYEIEKYYINQGYSENTAYLKSQAIMNDYWHNPINFLKYIFKGLKPGVGDFTKKLYYSGNQVIIFSSRKKATDSNLLGKIVKTLTILSLKLKGVKADKILFFPNDYEKTCEIRKEKIDVMFEDKPELIAQEQKMTNVIYPECGYNRDVEKADNIYNVSESCFNSGEALEATNKVITKRGGKTIPSDLKPGIYHRIIKHLEKKQDNYKYTDRFNSLIRVIGKPIVMKLYKPIVLHKENAEVEGPKIVAPNHRSTLDPFFVIGTTKFPIHWAALKRFFDADDSIFNNSKNPFLCKLTSVLFRMNGSIPIERISDNPQANNRESIMRMTKLVRADQNVGVFPEGTTNKSPETQHIGKSEKSGSLAFALVRENDHAQILPASIHWIKQKNIANRVIINYREPIKMDEVQAKAARLGLKFTDAAHELWTERIVSGLMENIEIARELEKEAGHSLKMVMYKNNR